MHEEADEPEAALAMLKIERDGIIPDVPGEVGPLKQIEELKAKGLKALTDDELKEMTTGPKVDDRKGGAKALAVKMEKAGAFNMEVGSIFVKMHDLIKDDDKKFAKAREGVKEPSGARGPRGVEAPLNHGGDVPPLNRRKGVQGGQLGQ